MTLRVKHSGGSMAKTKPAKKKTTVKKGPKKGAHATGTKKRASPRPKPRQPALPGHERVRSESLDACCEQIGEIRDKTNKLRKDEATEKRMALKEMVQKGIHAYRHAGVELVRVPGEEVLRVRKSKEDATDSSEPEDGGGEPEAVDVPEADPGLPDSGGTSNVTDPVSPARDSNSIF
jgi:hypothetical protein